MVREEEKKKTKKLSYQSESIFPRLQLDRHAQIAKKKRKKQTNTCAD